MSSKRLLAREEDASDPHVPLLLWWAVEAHALADLEDTLRRFTAPEAWQSGLCRSVILVRLVRRLAAVQKPRRRCCVCEAAGFVALGSTCAGRSWPHSTKQCAGARPAQLAPELARSIVELARR